MSTTPPTGQRVGSGGAVDAATDQPTRRGEVAATARAGDPGSREPAGPPQAAPRAGRPGTAADDGAGRHDESPVADPPTARAPRRTLGYRRQRFEARKVRRLVRHVDPWSMLKLALLLSLCMWLIVMIASVVLWTVARNAGTIESVESFVNSSLSLQDWQLDGDVIFRQFGLISLLLALGGTAAAVIASLVFNLVSDIIGGVWISVIEEETARPVAESNDGT